VIISVINLTAGQVSDEELQTTLRAINRQIGECFEPYWGYGATLRLEGHSGSQPDKLHLPDMRGEAVIYLWNQVDVDGALGYHDRNEKSIPFGIVFTELAQRLGESWTVTLSHEALELIAEPEVNLLVAGPHPTEPRSVLYWYEMCDAVQAESYEIDGVPVSNFVLPLYFTSGEETGGRNDFLARVHRGATLTSFGVNPGGYMGYFDPQTGETGSFSMPCDARAASRLEVRLSAGGTRRAVRYEELVKKA